MSKQHKVVVADDDFYLLDALYIQLNCEGYEVITLENGKNAFEVIKKEQPDCVILDVMMPGKTGIEVAREIKNDDETRFIPVILLTAKSELDDKMAGFESGIEDYITKPFDFRELNARIKSQIRLHNQIKEARENRFAHTARLNSDNKLNLVSWDAGVHTILFTNTLQLTDKRCLDLFKCHEKDCPMKLKNVDEDEREVTVNLSASNQAILTKRCNTNGINGNEILIIDHRSTRDIIERMVELNNRLLTDSTQLEKKSAESYWYLSNLNHELKGPLSAIIGYSEMVQQTQNEEKSKRYLDIIDKSARHIMTMMTELMDMTKIEHGKFSIHPELLSLSDLIDTVLSILDFHIDQRQIKVSTSFDPKFDLIKVDPNRFKQVLLNVISNAIKYNKVGGNINITSRSMNGKIQVTIQDSGVGIPSDVLPTVLGDFSLTDIPSVLAGGSIGTGLKLSRLLVLLHGGDMTIISKEGSGTTVTISFPEESIQSS